MRQNGIRAIFALLMERFAWKGKLRNWLPQYRENLTLAVPVMLSQVGQVVVQLADNAMVGRLGALPLAGVSFGGAVFVIFMFWVWAFRWG